MVSTSSPDEPKSTLPWVHTNVHNIRTVCLLALFVQLISLYTEFASIKITTLFSLVAMILANGYLIFLRWYHKADEQRDIQELLDPREDVSRKLWIFLALFGGIGISVAIHLMSPPLPAGIFAVLYILANYVLIAGSIVCPAMEIYEGVFEKRENRRRNL
ncbi:hypothetical protein Ddc_02838 [Ditylenchus destructor]|nr:hypothetical protein Ddc_02838 [Ditylenchus destructor]